MNLQRPAGTPRQAPQHRNTGPSDSQLVASGPFFFPSRRSPTSRRARGVACQNEGGIQSSSPYRTHGEETMTTIRQGTHSSAISTVGGPDTHSRRGSTRRRDMLSPSSIESCDYPLLLLQRPAFLPMPTTHRLPSPAPWLLRAPCRRDLVAGPVTRHPDRYLDRLLPT